MGKGRWAMGDGQWAMGEEVRRRVRGDEQEVQQLFFLGHGQDIFGLQAVVDAVLQQSDALIGESG
jgi:hypothetical protein